MPHVNTNPPPKGGGAAFKSVPGRLTPKKLGHDKLPNPPGPDTLKKEAKKEYDRVKTELAKAKKDTAKYKSIIDTLAGRIKKIHDAIKQMDTKYGAVNTKDLAAVKKDLKEAKKDSKKIAKALKEIKSGKYPKSYRVALHKLALHTDYDKVMKTGVGVVQFTYDVFGKKEKLKTIKWNFSSPESSLKHLVTEISDVKAYANFAKKAKPRKYTVVDLSSNPISQYRDIHKEISTFKKLTVPKPSAAAVAGGGANVTYNSHVVLLADGKYLTAESSGVVQMKVKIPEDRSKLLVLDSTAKRPKGGPKYGSDDSWMQFLNYTGRRFLQASSKEDKGLVYRYTYFNKRWQDWGIRKENANSKITIKRPKTLPKGYVYLGDTAERDYKASGLAVIFKDHSNIFQKPVTQNSDPAFPGYLGIWNTSFTGSSENSEILGAKCPHGFTKMGDVIFGETNKNKKHNHEITTHFRCIHNKYVAQRKQWWDASSYIWRPAPIARALQGIVLNTDVAISFPLAYDHDFQLMKVHHTFSDPSKWGWTTQPFLNEKFFHDFSYWADKNQVRGRVGGHFGERQFLFYKADDLKYRGPIKNGDSVIILKRKDHKFLRVHGPDVMADESDIKKATHFTIMTVK